MTSRRFILHESSQRSLCRLAFVVFGAAPLVFCLYLCIAAMIPGYHRRQAAIWEQELESKFGLKFRVTEAYTLAPCKYRLEGVQVLQARSSKLVGRCATIEVQLDNRLGWQVKLQKPELRLDQIALAGKELHEHFLSQHAMPTAVIQSDRLTVSDDEDTIELAEVNLSLSNSTELAGMSAGFRIVPAVGNLTTEPLNHLVVVRRHPAATTYDVGLRVHRLSCAVLSKIFDLNSATAASGVRHSLQSCLFSGIMGIHTEGNKSNYYLRDASIHQIDMGQVVLGSESMISGMAKIDELNAIFDASQIHMVQGKLAVEAGRIDAQFLNSVAYHLQMSVVPQTSVRNIAFDRLSLEFNIIPQFVELAGVGSKPGVVLEDAQGPLAWKTKSTQPIMSLVHALAYRTDNPTLPSRITPLVRTALVWLPLEEQQRREAELVIRR